jgi:hypothetical protein
MNGPNGIRTPDMSVDTMRLLQVAEAKRSRRSDHEER